MKKIFLIFICLSAIFIFLRNLSYVLLPNDILYTLPSFSFDKWERPNNSLLADPLFQFEPWRKFAKEQMLNGRLPLWNDLNGAGAPFLANPQTQVFYPLNLLYYVFPTEISLLLIHILKLSLFLVFTYFYLKSIGLSKSSSAMGSIFASSGFMMLWLQWPHTNVYLFFPLLLLVTEKFNKSSRKLVLFLSGIYFLALLGGHPETLFLVFVIHSIYTFFRFGKKVFYVVISIIWAFLMSSFLTLPFIEYLLNSSMLNLRTTQVYNHTIPLQAIFLNIFPFVLGAPHLLFYKPIQGTNFQEALGGYTGLISVIFFIYGYLKIKKNKIIDVFVLIIFICLFFSYQIPIVSDIIRLTPLNISANHRLVAFLGFGISVVSAIGIKSFLEKKDEFLSFDVKPFVFFGLAISISPLFLSIPSQYKQFYFYIFPFILIVLISTFLFLKKSKKLDFLSLFFLVLVQTVFLFATYNTVSKKSLYYPDTEIISLLKNKNARVLEVGNPNLPPEINMIYGIEMAENNDALGIFRYDTEFNKSFPIRNHWKKVDAIALDSLNKFGITHVVSDYDINLQKVNLQKDINSRINLDKKITHKLKKIGGKLSQLRFITFNFNRLNTCLVNIYVKEGDNTVSSGRFDCKDVRDGMFYTVNVGEVMLDKNLNYTVEIVPHNASNNNFIALTGSEKEPYLDLLFKNSRSDYKEIFNKKSVYVFEVAGLDPLINIKNYEVVLQNPDRLILKVKSDKESLTVNKVNYPGWNVYVNGEKILEDENDVFLKFNIPQGTHLVRISYESKVFILGIFVSFISIAVFFVFLFRLIFQNFQAKLFYKYKAISKKIKNKVSYFDHITYIFVSLPFSISAYLLIQNKIPILTTSENSINWLTANNYSKANDYINLFLFAGIIFSFGILSWLFFIWRKIKK